MSVVEFDQSDHIATITLNRPEAMNAMGAGLGEALWQALLDFRNDPDLWCAIITGAGDRAFSAGADLKDFAGRNPDWYKQAFWDQGPTWSYRQLQIWKPMIAAVNGYALGGGCQLALCCDVIIAADTATFGMTEGRWGLVAAGHGGTQLLARRFPLSWALQMLFTGERISAQEVYRLGVVNQVVPLSELMGAARAMAEKITANPPLAARGNKEAVYRGLEMTFEQGLRFETALSRITRDTEDAKEGPRAFAEKRKPVYHGR